MCMSESPWEARHCEGRSEAGVKGGRERGWDQGLPTNGFGRGRGGKGLGARMAAGGVGVLKTHLDGALGLKVGGDQAERPEGEQRRGAVRRGTGVRGLGRGHAQELGGRAVRRRDLCAAGERVGHVRARRECGGAAGQGLFCNGCCFVEGALLSLAIPGAAALRACRVKN